MKKIITITSIFICTVAIGLSIYTIQDTSNISDLISIEVEALAQNHSGDSGTGEPTCFAGGCHSTSCTWEGEIAVLGHISSSISCEDAWACCHATAFCFEKKRCGW